MKRLVVIIMCLIFLKAVNCFAEPTHKHTCDLGVIVSYIEYEEPGIMEEKGVMQGVTGSYTYREKYMLKLEGRLIFGEVDYEGQLDDGTSYSVDNIDDYLFEVRGLVGYDFPLLIDVTVTPYLGMGYRYLNDGLDKDIYGYERESNYFYSPLGIEANRSFYNGWSLKLKVEYDYFWKGIQKSHLSDVNAGLGDLENDQNKGYGARASIGFLKENKSIDFLIEPYIIYWSIDKSEDASVTYGGNYIGYAWEPKNNSQECGINFIARF